MAKINEGDVVIALNGEEITLRPTLKALSAISSNGGLGKVRQISGRPLKVVAEVNVMLGATS